MGMDERVGNDKMKKEKKERVFYVGDCEQHNTVEYMLACGMINPMAWLSKFG